MEAAIMRRSAENEAAGLRKKVGPEFSVFRIGMESYRFPVRDWRHEGVHDILDDFLGIGYAPFVVGNNTTDIALYTEMNKIVDYKPTYHMTATYTTKDGVYTYDGVVQATQMIGNLPSGNVAVTANIGATSSNPGSWNYTANAAPEPTSDLLLLLGVAGLALRRRHA